MAAISCHHQHSFLLLLFSSIITIIIVVFIIHVGIRLINMAAISCHHQHSFLLLLFSSIITIIIVVVFIIHVGMCSDEKDGVEDCLPTIIIPDSLPFPSQSEKLDQTSLAGKR